jgi:hypothetical protein
MHGRATVTMLLAILLLLLQMQTCMKRQVPALAHVA